MTPRQTTGFVESLLRLAGLDWAVPDFSTLCRRQKTLNVSLPYRGAMALSTCSSTARVSNSRAKRPSRQHAMHAPDGNKWNAHKHGDPKRRIWRKLPMGIDEETLEVRASRYLGKALWRCWSEYHRQSRVETKMTCIKLLGQSQMSRDFDRQVAEIQVRIAVLNRHTALGIPVTEAVG